MEHVRALETAGYEVDTVEWFLVRYLKKVVKSTEAGESQGKVEGSMRSLVRFYVDNIDERSELGDRCMKIYEQYRKTLRRSQDDARL